MLRLRRYRVFLIFALITLVLLLHASRHSRLAPPPPPPSSPYKPAHPDPDRVHGQGQGRPQRESPVHVAADGAGAVAAGSKEQEKEQEKEQKKEQEKQQQQQQQQTIQLPHLKPIGEAGHSYGLPTPAGEPLPAPTIAGVGLGEHGPARDSAQADGARVLDIPHRGPGTVEDIYQGSDGTQQPSDAYEAPAVPSPAAPTSTPIHWTKTPQHFPIPEESLVALPTGKPKSIPTVQYHFGEESEAAKAKRETRLAKVKAEAERAWLGYKKYAWTHDELKPISKTARDPFCGWAATMVDSLDALWIMGMADEFNDAVKAVAKIDFTTTPFRTEVPVFETVIRYLGGLLSAYDVSGGHSGNHKVLLDKALELAELLMAAFDTPNRMPVLYYNWKPTFASQPRRASTSVSLAELGSLSMEFTRLAQLTGENRYYDAIARITDALVEWQNRGTLLPGIFPERVDASGCNRSATLMRDVLRSSKDAQAQVQAARDLSSSLGHMPSSASDRAAKPQTGGLHGAAKRDVEGGNPHPLPVNKPVDAAGNPADWDCVPQGLTQSGSAPQSFSMGGSQDSTYEYFPKEYLLLGGLEPKYRSLHEKAVKGIKDYLLYRPMTEDDQDILFTAKAATSPGVSQKIRYDYEVTHLTCFIGGMFGLGGRIFEKPEDVEIGKKLTDGCVWAYETFPTGIMPEMSTVVPCQETNDCSFNRTLWWSSLDPISESRHEQLEQYEKKMEVWRQELKEFEKEVALRKQAEEEAAQLEQQQQQQQQQQLQLQLQQQRQTTGPEAVEAAGNPQPSPVSDLSGTSQGAGGAAPPVHKRDSVGGGTAADMPTEAGQATGSAKKPQGAGLTDEPRRQGADQTKQAESPDYDLKPLRPPREPRKPLTHEQYVAGRIENERLPPGFVSIRDRRYILRPEAIESVWYMYRITGDPSWQDKGWRMFEAVIDATQTSEGHSAIDDVTTAASRPTLTDYMESFWMAETLKYYYLLFSEPDVISLDEWVLNTEAHPFRRPG